MNDVVVAGAGPNGLMLARELGLSGIRPIVLDPLPGPNPEPRANGVTGQGVRILDHRGFYSELSGTAEPPRPNPWSMFAAFMLDLSDVADSQVFMIPVQQPRLVQALAKRATDDGVDIRWGHRLAGFDQNADAVTVYVDGPDGPYELSTRYLVGADGGTSATRKLAGIDFPGMTSHDAVARMAFGVVPPDDWVDPVSGALDIPGWGRVPPTPFYRAERGIFACRRLGDRAIVITLELDPSAREDSVEEHGDEPPVSLPEIEASVKRVLGADLPLRPVSPDATVGSASLLRHQLANRVALPGGAGVLGRRRRARPFPAGWAGANLGLQDAVNLGWKLAAVIAWGAKPALLDTYEAERRAAATRVIMHSRAQLALSGPAPKSLRCENFSPSC